MLMALLVLVGFGALYLFVFDEELQGGPKTMESIIADQAKEIETYQANLSKEEKRLEVLPALAGIEKKLADVILKNRFNTGKIDGMKKNVDAVQEQITKQLEEMEIYKLAYRTEIRAKAKGTSLDELKTKDGKVYTKVRISRVTAQAMHIQYADGLSAIPYEKLPDDMQDLYQFNTKEKQAFLAGEKMALEKHLGAVNDAQKMADEQAAQQSKEQEAADKRQRTEDIKTLKQRISRKKQDISTQQGDTDENLKPMRHTSAMDARLREAKNELEALIAALAKLESKN